MQIKDQVWYHNAICWMSIDTGVYKYDMIQTLHYVQPMEVEIFQHNIHKALHTQIVRNDHQI